MPTRKLLLFQEPLRARSDKSLRADEQKTKKEKESLYRAQPSLFSAFRLRLGALGFGCVSASHVGFLFKGTKYKCVLKFGWLSRISRMGISAKLKQRKERMTNKERRIRFYTIDTYITTANTALHIEYSLSIHKRTDGRKDGRKDERVDGYGSNGYQLEPERAFREDESWKGVWERNTKMCVWCFGTEALNVLPEPRTQSGVNRIIWCESSSSDNRSDRWRHKRFYICDSDRLPRAESLWLTTETYYTSNHFSHQSSLWMSGSAPFILENILCRFYTSWNLKVHRWGRHPVTFLLFVFSAVKLQRPINADTVIWQKAASTSSVSICPHCAALLSCFHSE